MFYKLLTRQPLPAVEISPYYNKLVIDTVAEGERFSRVSSFKRVKCASDLDKFSVNDFKLNSILSVGAYDMLKPVYAPDTNALNVVSQVEAAIKSFGNEQVVQTEK